ncbi:Sel1 repeat-containing protein [Tahibacter aquaticus]|jgi:TPR repeat protein|uniref:Sel1 repeat-containing protein n=1 Tax=Tahibacter aquaticus TaxID=520092 RepID=A0A4R6Z998_9GAMM|nr:SEL1-like repeat protein [Tahibacter aquaticus]TDR48471.1 Sel1 repeat-containing protein [Tahibacter aquaticus]
MKDEMRLLQGKASRGSGAAQLELGHGYMSGRLLSGESIECDYAQARYWLQQAHAQGVATASLLLGMMNEEGLGGEADPVAAIALYEVAAQHGDVISCLRLARLHAASDSRALAEDWYRKVLQLGTAEADADEIAEAKAYLADVQS